MSANTSSATLTCPACGLLCDDIRPAQIACQKAVQFFAQKSDAQPQIAGKNVSLQAAIAHAASMLKLSQNPVLAGMSTDIAGFKALQNLAQHTNAAMQHINAQSMSKNLKVLQSADWQATTLTEVKNRADIIVCIGSDIVSHNPRFFERFVDIEGMFAGGNVSQRQVVYLGGANPPQAALHLPCSLESLPEILSVLQALLLGKTINAQSVASLEINALQNLAAQLKAAKYAVLAWAAKDLQFPHAELAIEQITKIVATLNQSTRAACLPLGGSDGDTSANYIHTWRNGQILAENSQAKPDLQIWVNSFNAEAPPAFCHTPTIVLGNANTPWAEHADVFIPVATPGLDCAGTLFRVDGAVALPLKQVRDSGLPTLAQVLENLQSILAADARR